MGKELGNLKISKLPPSNFSSSERRDYLLTSNILLLPSNFLILTSNF